VTILALCHSIKANHVLDPAEFRTEAVIQYLLLKVHLSFNASIGLDRKVLLSLIKSFALCVDHMLIAVQVEIESPDL
jgi:hypothetical protein